MVIVMIVIMGKAAGRGTAPMPWWHASMNSGCDCRARQLSSREHGMLRIGRGMGMGMGMGMWVRQVL